MARLNIPSAYRSPLASIRSLSEESVQRIRALLDRVTLPETGNRESDSLADPGAIITAMKQSAPATKVSEVREIVEAIAVLYEIKSQRDITVEQFVDEICDAMQAVDSEDLRLRDSERADFAGKLLTLLNAEVFALVAKAHDLASEDEHTFCHARILTDLRPVFGASIDEGPKAMVVMHKLKLAYHEQGAKSHRRFYVALDADDLQQLKQLIKRAEEKANSLESTFKGTHLFGASKA